MRQSFTAIKLIWWTNVQPAHEHPLIRAGTFSSRFPGLHTSPALAFYLSRRGMKCPDHSPRDATSCRTSETTRVLRRMTSQFSQESKVLSRKNDALPVQTPRRCVHARQASPTKLEPSLTVLQHNLQMFLPSTRVARWSKMHKGGGFRSSSI